MERDDDKAGTVMPAHTQKITYICPTNSSYRVELDSEEYDAVDPGNGTPALVVGPRGEGTFFCCLDTGEIDGLELPCDVKSWLDAIQGEVFEFLDALPLQGGAA